DNKSTVKGVSSHYALIAILVDKLVLADPGHHAAQPRPDLFDWMGVVAGARRLERGLIDLVLEHPVAGEFARLNILEHALHLRLGGWRDNARSSDIFAIFGGVGHRIIHI